MKGNNYYSNIFTNIFNVVCVFFYIYQCNLLFLGLPFVYSSVQLSWGLMLIMAIITRSKKHHVFKDNTEYSVWKTHVRYLLILLLYSIFLLLNIGHGDGTHIIDTLTKIILYGVSTYWIWSIFFEDIEDFMRVLLTTGVIQTIIIIICLVNPPLTVILDSTLNYNPDLYSSHIASDLRELYAGGIGCITSSGLVKYVLTGMLPCVYFCVKTQKNIYFKLFFVMSFCAAILARTGLLLDIIMLVFIFYRNFRLRNLFYIGFVLVVSLWIISSIAGSGLIDNFIDRYEDAKSDNGMGFFEAYFYGPKALYPPLQVDTFWGVGITAGRSANGYDVNVDGGPMRQYCAIGILGCVLFYYFIIKNQIRAIKLIKNQLNKQILWLYLVCLFVCEWKEVTYMGTWPLMLFLFIALLIKKEENLSNV